MCLQDFFWYEESLVFGYHSRAHGTTKSVLDLHAVGFATEEDADGWVFIGALNITIEGFEIELKLTKVAWVELASFEFYSYQTLETTVIEKKVAFEGRTAYRKAVFFFHEKEILTEFEDEVLHVLDYGFTQASFLKLLRKTQEINIYGIAKLERRIGILFFERLRHVAFVTPYERSVCIVGNNSLELFVFETLTMCVEDVKEALGCGLTSSDNLHMVGDTGKG